MSPFSRFFRGDFKNADFKQFWLLLSFFNTGWIILIMLVI